MPDLRGSAEYWQEIEDIAREVRAEAKEDNRDEQDVLHETIDSHQWVIYTSYNLDVLRYCSNPDAGIEEGLIDANAAIKEGGMDRLYAQLAYCAMEADVQEALSELEDEDEEEEEDAND